MRRQSGFTLIELIIVIVVLGILAALAVPRFISLQREARIAVIDSLFTSLRSGSNVVYAKSAAAGRAGLANSTIDLDGSGISGGTIQTNYGYPAARSADLQLLFDNLSARYTIGAGATTPGTMVTISLDGITNCSVSYTSSNAAGVPPTITRNVSAC
ncbi:prepilin-type N-terminal cleavage/methylation domain-containing protein [Silanimonas lenta]|uniref:prepilin-type N-terminal cleavage/methylation domain-containing protein n=1 Tax=Silanimonas lenta TaxID=265429 RepID=UPI000406ECE1